MEKSNCFNDFVKYSSLNIMGMIGLSCYILADTFFVSKGLGANGLTALNLAIPIYSFIHGSGLMIGMGGGIKYSIHKYQGNQKACDHIFTNAMYLAAIMACLFVFAGLFFTDALVTFFGADQDVFAMTKTYTQVILLFAPAFLINNVLLCFVRNDGEPQRSMAAMIGGSLSNVVLDYVFIFPCNMGIFGAVFATGLAPVISMLILSPHFISKRNCFHLIRCKCSGSWLADIVSGGLPSLVTEMSSGVVIIVFNTLILALEGNTGVAAYGVIANLSLVVIAIYTGIAQGIQPIISSNFGANHSGNVRSILRYALITMLLLSGVIYAGISLGAAPIVSVFNSEHNELLQSIAVRGLKLYFLACPFAGFNIILSAYFTSSDYARPAHVISLLRGFILILPLAFLLADLAGMTGIWCAFPVAELIVSIVGIVLFIFSNNREKLSRLSE